MKDQCPSIDAVPELPLAGPRPSKLGLALGVIALAKLMIDLDVTVVNVALPRVQHVLGFSGSGLEWVVNAYALAFGGLLLLGGRLGDILGRRSIFIAGLVVDSILQNVQVSSASSRNLSASSPLIAPSRPMNISLTPPMRRGSNESRSHGYSRP